PGRRRGRRPPLRVRRAGGRGPARPLGLRRGGAAVTRLVGRGALLVVLWLLAWGDANLGNLVSGVIVAAGLLAAFPPARTARHRLRPSLVGIVRLGVYVVRQLVTSNVVVALQIVRPSTTL